MQRTVKGKSWVSVVFACTALAVVGCAFELADDDEAASTTSDGSHAVREGLRLNHELPKCKDTEQLCCPRGGPACSCIPKENTCSSGFVVTPGSLRP